MRRLFRSTKFLCCALAALVGVSPALAQGQGAVLTGQVLSDQGQPLQGVNVRINELNISVGTNQSGTFTLSIPAARITGRPVVLRVRAIGYQPQNRQIALTSGSQTINFSLPRDVTQLSSVVVTGVTAATETIKLPFTVARLDSSLMPVTGSNPLTQLQGKIPGAMIVSSSGRPGQAPSVVLRGPVSLDATGRSQAPLFLLDGVPLQGSLPDINPSDIENVEVVKGAAAAALYGARAGAGVINITTKTGKSAPQGVRFGVRTEVGSSDVEGAFPLATRTPMTLDPSGKFFCTTESAGGSSCARYIDWDTEVQRINNNPGQTFTRSPQQFKNEGSLAGAPTYDPLTGSYVVNQWPLLRDPVKQLITSSVYANSSVDIRGKMNNTGIYASLGNLTQQGPVRYMGGFVRNSGRVNVDQRFGDRISANISTFYSQTLDHGAQLDANNAGSASPFFTITRAPWIANMQARDSLGKIVTRHNPTAQGVQNRNPLYINSYDVRADRGTRFVGGASAKYAPFDWLALDGSFGYDRSTGVGTEMNDRGYMWISDVPAISAGYIRNVNADNEQFTTGLGASANRTFGDLSATLTSRYTYGDQTLRAQTQYGEDLVVAGLETSNAATKNYAVTSSVQQIRDMGAYLGGDFDFKDRYIFSALIRRDGSSLFGSGNRWQTFGRVAGAWIASREPWWPAPDAISLFKLRASQGTTGQRPRFTAQYEAYTIGVGGTLNPAQLGNKNLKPELNKELEVGTDLEFFGKFGVNISYARAVIDDQILPVRASTASGFSSQWLNAGELTNKTWEGTLTLPIISRGSMNWTARVIYDRTRSVITRLDVPDFTGDITAANTFTVFKFRKGEKLGTMYGVDFVRKCDQLPPAFVSACSMNATDASAAWRPNDMGFIVWVGTGNQLTEGITKNLWRAQLPLGSGPWGNRTNWGMPIQQRICSNDACTRGDFANVPLGSAIPKYHWGMSHNIDFKRLNVYGLIDASRGAKLFNIQYAWSLADMQSKDVAQDGKSVEDAKPMGYYWRQGPSSSPTSGSVAGVGGLYDILGPNGFNVQDASYVKLRELAVNYRIGAIGGTGDWKVGFVGRNLKTWSNWLGFDPESGSTSGPLASAALTGVAGYNYPKLRSYTVQVSTSF